MDERVVQFRVGVMVFATLIITAILLVLFEEVPGFVMKLFQRTYTVRLWFPEARGVDQDTLVRRNGILIGRVKEVRFPKAEERDEFLVAVKEAEYPTGVVVTAEINEGKSLYKNDVCRIQSDLLGKTSLEFARAEGKPSTDELLESGVPQRGQIQPDPRDALTNVTQTLTQVAPTVTNAGEALVDASSRLGAAADRVTALLDKNEEKVNDAITNANTMMQTVDDVGNIFKELAGDERDRERLRQAMRTLPDTLQDMRSTVAGAKARIGEIEQFTKKLGSTELIDRMERGTKHLDAMMDDLAMFSQRLRNPNGSLALLLEDRELYDHLNRAATNVDQLSRQLKPIISDVRVFTDKIARHPESLGVRGAIQRSPGIK